MSIRRLQVLEELLDSLYPFQNMEDIDQYHSIYTSGMKRVREEIVELDKLRSSVDHDGSILRKMQEGLVPISAALYHDWLKGMRNTLSTLGNY